jgi:hypothetical protein
MQRRVIHATTAAARAKASAFTAKANQQALAAALAQKQCAAKLEQPATQVVLHLAHHEARQPT